MKTFKDLLEAKMSNNGLALFTFTDSMFILYDPSQDFKEFLETYDYDTHEAVKGIISIKEVNSYNQIAEVWAQKGFGPNMYEIALSQVGREGIAPTIDPHFITPAAKKVWKKFYDRTDIITDDIIDGRHLEDYLNKKYYLKKPVAIKRLMNRNTKFIGKDPYGEFSTLLLEYFDGIVQNEMREIYGS